MICGCLCQNCRSKNVELPLYYLQLVRLFKEDCVNWNTKTGKKKNKNQKVVWKTCLSETSEAQTISCLRQGEGFCCSNQLNREKTSTLFPQK